MPNVLICLGCSDKNTMNWVAGNMHCSQFWRPAVQEEGTSTAGFWGGLSPGVWTAYFLLCPHMVEGARELSRAAFYKGTNLLQEGSILMT